MLRCFALPLLLALACTGSHIPSAKDPHALIECTDRAPRMSEGLDLDNPPESHPASLRPRWARDDAPVELPPATVANAMAAAARWAHEFGYLPCSVQMCGELRRSTPGHVAIYLRFEGAFREIESGTLIVSPEAEVLVELNTFRVTDALRFHSGCAQPPPSASAPAA